MSGRGRFRFYVLCGACSFMTGPARTEGIAAKLWNAATPLEASVKPKRARRQKGVTAPARTPPRRAKRVPRART